MIFGLSNARVGATLAVVLVGYNIILRETEAGVPIRLLNEDVLNGTILMILVTCTISSFVVEKASRKLALENEDEVTKDTGEEKILISLAYPDKVTELVDFGLTLKPKKSEIPVYALHIISDENNDGSTHAEGKKMMDKAIHHAAATENTIIPLTRFDMNIGNGIIYTIKEQKITDVLIGLHQSTDQKDFLGDTTERILKRTSENIYIYKSIQPFNTLKRMIVAAPPKAELEPGFSHWFTKLATIAKEGGISIVFYAEADTTKHIEELNSIGPNPIKLEFIDFTKWEDFLILSSELKQNDLLVIVASRKGHVSYNEYLDKLPYYLTNYFKHNSYILLYPKQLEIGLHMDDIQHIDTSLLESISEKVNLFGKTGNYIKKIFKGK